MIKKQLYAWLAVILLLAPSNASAAQTKYQWNLADIYTSEADFERDYQTAADALPKLSAYEGKLQSAANVSKLFALNERIARKLEKLSLYAHLKQDLNIEDETAARLKAKVEALISEYAAKTAFIEPELLSLSEQTLAKLQKSKALKQYRYYFKELREQKKHTLSKQEEQLLAKLSPIMSDPENIYNNAARGDYEPPSIRTPDGKTVSLTEENYTKALEHPDRSYRKRAFQTRFQSYEAIENTSAATLYASVKADELYAKARKYRSGLEAALSADDVPKQVFTNLISTVNDHLPSLHRYVELRKKALGIDRVHSYDMYVPLVDEAVAKKMKFPIETAQTLLLEGLKPLGGDYIKHVKLAFEQGWLDAYPRPKKYTGGYNTSAYDTHPFILLNYDESLDGMLTIAHEIGHAMNSVYTNNTQPYHYSGQSIFTAEVASTANEWLMMDYLMKRAKTDEEKLYLLNQQLEQIRGTLYTQVMYSEFEQAIHNKVRQGGSLTAAELNDLWLRLLKKYHGPAYAADPEAARGWLRIPHLYDAFYVYKYATSLAASFELVKQMKADKTGEATKRYLQFLSAGTSDDPIRLLQKTGVDMTSSKPLENLLSYFDLLVRKMEQQLKMQRKL
ncbi:MULTISPECIES: oligoendopeptidase F [Parageobacillus]|jgi:oligoendopeptidase F|uniref:Oligopeptidase F n=1 Tax=Parageobacillus thermoglucosidasius TaxID=1426 RepID=A0A1B7KM62_PARTM|nr:MULTISPECIES: oligoendopeptidase F [Parageobacillus]OAT71168.1 oligoendopeptidase F [Parageobacillus thermoglucosidasius]BDG47468.1 oligoendopeptidase F [Parageobacillus sp. KH3-4]